MAKIKIKDLPKTEDPAKLEQARGGLDPKILWEASALDPEQERLGTIPLKGGGVADTSSGLVSSARV